MQSYPEAFKSRTSSGKEILVGKEIVLTLLNTCQVEHHMHKLSTPILS